MPLKKLPPELNYAALREHHPPKANERESGESTKEEETPTQVEPKQGGASETADATRGEGPSEDGAQVSNTEPAPQPIPSAPLSDGPKGQADATPQAKGGQGTPRTNARGDGSASQADTARRAASATAGPSSDRASLDRPSPERVTLRGYVQIPMEGVSESFDELVAFHGERKALSLVLTAGLKAYGAALEEGRAPSGPSGYTSLDSVEVVRKLPPATVEAAKAALDPRGLLGNYQLGGLIFKTAMTFYLARM